MEKSMIEHIIKKYMDDLDKEIELLNIERDKITKTIDNKLKERADAAIELQRVCRHIDTKKDNTYTSGGYDHTSTSTTIITCTQCNKILDTWTKQGGYA